MAQNHVNQIPSIEDSLNNISAKFKEMRETYTSSSSTIYERHGDVVVVSLPSDVDTKTKK